jgi:hypothetical protein
MGRYLLTTTPEQDAGIKYAYDQAQAQPPLPGVPPIVETQAEYLTRRITDAVLTPMVYDYDRAVDASILGSMYTIPPPNRPQARTDIETVIVDAGGTIIPPPEPPPPETLPREALE